MGQKLDHPRIWITRTQARASASARRYEALGYAPIIAPLLTVGPPKIAPALPPEHATLIFTSQNGIDAFCALTARRDFSVITVGDATADTAKARGFVSVMSAGGSAVDVTAMILDAPDVGAFYWHVAGRHARGSIVEALLSAGLSAARHIYYATQPVGRWPSDGEVLADDIITVYSPLAANALTAFGHDLSDVTILSMSAAARAAFGQSPVARHLIAEEPTESAMIAALQDFAQD